MISLDCKLRLWSFISKSLHFKISTCSQYQPWHSGRNIISLHRWLVFTSDQMTRVLVMDEVSPRYLWLLENWLFAKHREKTIYNGKTKKKKDWWNGKMSVDPQTKFWEKKMVVGSSFILSEEEINIDNQLSL